VPSDRGHAFAAASAGLIEAAAIAAASILLVLACAVKAAATDIYSAPVASSSALTVPALAGLLVIGNPKDVAAEGTPDVRGIEVRGVPALDNADFKTQMASHLGRPLSDEYRAAIVNDTVRFLREHGHAIVDVSLPPQEITGGVLQVVVLEGKVGRVRVEGNGWFSSQLLVDQLTAKPGQEVDARRLTRDLDWLNRSPFRQVELMYAKGLELGQTDLVLKVRDRFPLNVYGGYDDSGTRVTGNNRLMTGLNWGNVLGGDGAFNYQYMADPAFKWFRGHSASLVQPLPWRHILTVLGNYVDTHGNVAPPFDLSGFSWQTSLRYEVPLPRWRSTRLSFQEALVAGFDFKRANSNLAFGGEQVFGALTDSAQWSLAYNSSLKDPWGASALSSTLFYSPGRWTDSNTDSAYRLSRAGATARYVYGRIELSRTTGLPFGFALVNHLSFQRSDSNLLASEQLGLGGYDTIRGYDSRVVNGDQGYIISNELRTPAIGLLSHCRIKRLTDRLQILGFFDYGSVSNRDLLARESPRTVLAGVGSGLRYSIASNLSFRLDYGWQLRNAHDQRLYASRSHIGLVLSY
jgi:hemolysin activation/secretion protein